MLGAAAVVAGLAVVFTVGSLLGYLLIIGGVGAVGWTMVPAVVAFLCAGFPWDARHSERGESSGQASLRPSADPQRGVRSAASFAFSSGRIGSLTATRT